MKKIIAAFLLSIGLTVLVPVTAFASPTDTRIYGTAYEIGGSSVANAEIRVTCNGHLMVTSTDASGAYQVFFSAADCPIGGGWPVVTAKKGNLSGTHSEPVLDFGQGLANINVGMTQGVAVPEMSTIALTTAGVLSVGIFLIVRRRTKQVKA